MTEKPASVQRIKALAAELGFDQVGIIRPENLKPGEEKLLAWIADEKHAGMKFLEDFESRRNDFYQNFGTIRSIIVLGINYFSLATREDSSSEKLRGRVARYAWGKDYHQVIRERHQHFIVRLKEILNRSFKAQSCVDIQPIAERFAAAQAGMGFTGKHTGLLNVKFGPWLFLSEIVTDLELDEDLPSQGDCGTCDHCQTACPTGALNKDYELDARLCIAYLTIEHKGIIPEALRPLVKDWVFGCDECLVVCPFTAKSKTTNWKEFLPESGQGEWLELASLFDLESNSSYEKKFQGTALLRAGRKQMLRNACLVLGNSGKAEAVPLLAKALSDKAELVRLHAAWALGRLPFKESAEVLQNRHRQEPELSVREEIEKSLRVLSQESSSFPLKKI